MPLLSQNTQSAAQSINSDSQGPSSFYQRLNEFHAQRREEDEEEEVSEDEQDSTTFAEDLQDLMANHQMTAPENLFSNDTFIKNLTQFLKSYQIKVHKALFLLPQEDAEAEINNQDKPIEIKEEPSQSHGIFQELKTKNMTEKLLPSKGNGLRSVKNKIKKQMYSVIPL